MVKRQIRHTNGNRARRLARQGKFSRISGWAHLEAFESRVLLSAYYVSPLGSDSAAGTAAAPWKTLQQAADMVQAGDVVTVEPGQYAGFVMGWNNPQNGTASAPIVFNAQPGAVITTRNYETQDGIDLEGCSYITIEGFTITNDGSIQRAGIRAVGYTAGTPSTNVIIENNNVSGMGDWGIFTAFSNNLLIQNNTASDSQNQHGIYVSNSPVNARILDNTTFGNTDCGIEINGDITQGGTGIATGALIAGNIIYDNDGSGINCDGMQNSVIENNLLYNNHASGIALYMDDSAAGSTGNVVVNNTIIEASDARWCININTDSTGNTVYNNILDNQNTNNGAITITADSMTGFKSDYNVIINNQFTANGGDTDLTLTQWQTQTGQDMHSIVSTESAVFVDASSNNYQLAVGSPAIDAGTSIDAPTADLPGNPRPSGAGFDIGAYELQQGTTTVSATTTILSASASTSIFGQAVTFTATVAPDTPDVGTPAGIVNFYDGSTLLYSGTLNSTGSATFTTNNGSSGLGLGTHVITSVYNGDMPFLASTEKISQVVDHQPTHLVLSPVASIVVAGQTIPSFTIKAEDAQGNIVTADNSNFTISLATPTNGATLGGTLTEQAQNGIATFSGLSLTQAGKYTLVATDGALTTGKSNSFTVIPDASSAQLVLVAQSAATLVGKTLAPNIVVDVKDQYGNIVTANHSTVTLSITAGPGGHFIGTISTNASNGVATFNKVAISHAGAYTIQATDGSLPIITPVSFSQTITQGTTTVTKPSVSSSYIFGATITLSTTLKSNAPTTIPFTGTATITDQNSDVLGTVNVSTNGAVKFVLTGLTPGSYVCTLAYPGDVNFTAVTSTAFTLNILQAATTTTLKASSTQFVSGQGVTLTATVASTNAPATARTGTITFKDGATVIGTVNLSSSMAALTISTPTVGTHAYTAVYSSDTNFKASASSTQNVTVKKDTTHAALTTSAVGLIVPGQQFTLTAVITDVAPGVGTPTGTVTFKDGSKVLGTSNLVSGTATLLTSLTTAGNHSLTAVYGGDGQSNTTTSATLPQVVTKAVTTTVVSSPNATVSSGTNVTFTAVVTPTSPANLIPTGKVVFKNGNTTLATVTLLDGQAMWTTTTPLIVGSHSITADYLGDNNDLLSNAAVYTQTID